MKIFKYALGMTGMQYVEMPKGAQVRHLGFQNFAFCIWAEVDPDAEKVERQFYILGTGHTIPEGLEYVGTVFQPGTDLVWHLFEAAP